MGVKGLLKLIKANKESVCTECDVQGELIIDGHALLHELYDQHELDWENEGRYAQQCQITLDYFQALKKIGIKPIVILNGGSTLEQLEESLERRKVTIAELPEMIEKKHRERETKCTLPLMAREIFVSCLRDNGISVYVADGKAMKTIVYLANYYKYPILVTNTNYCICNVVGGVIFTQLFDNKTGKAFIYKQTKFVEFFGLCNPDLLCAVWAIMGDKGYVPGIFYGRIRAQIKMCVESDFKSKLDTVIEFVQMKFTSFQECRDSCWARENFDGQHKAFLDNCYQVEALYKNIYFTDENTLSMD